MGTVLLREFKALIGNIYAIATAVVFSVASGILFTYNNIAVTYPTIDAVVATMSLVAAILIPVVACFSINGERKKGTDEFLLALPVTGGQIVLGKFFGILAFFMIPTGVMFVYPVIAGFFGDPAFLYSYITLLYFVVFEAFIIALSMTFSAIFKKSWLSVTITYSVLVVLFLIGSLSSVFPEVISDICKALSPFRQFDPIVFGVLDLASLAYFLLLTVTLLTLIVRVSNKKKKGKKAKEWTIKTAAVAAVSVVAIVALSVLPTTVRWVDISKDKIYSTSSVTEQLIDRLDEEITVYLINSSSSEQKLVNAIERYCDRSKYITLEKVNTSKDTEFAERYGLNADADLSYCLVIESARRWRFVSSDTLFVWYNSEMGYMSTSDYSNTLTNLEAIIDEYYPYYSSMSSSQQSQLEEYINTYDSLATDVTQCLDVENVLSSAIEYVTADVIPTFYFASGHGEKNTQGGPLDIKGLTKLPEEVAMLVINTPDEDYSDSEADMLIDFMNKGGRLIVFTDKQNNSMPNLSRILAVAGLSLEPDAIAEGVSETTVKTTASALSLLAGTTEKLTLGIIDGDSILTDTENSALTYTPLYTLDMEVSEETTDESGEVTTTTKVITKNLGVSVEKNSEPMLVWITGSDTFNRNQSELSDEELEDYSVAMYGVSSLVLWTSKSFESSLEEIMPVAYVPTLLTVDEKGVGVVGGIVIGTIPALMLGYGLIRLYLRKKRSRKVAA